MTNAYHYANTFDDALANEFEGVLSMRYDPRDMQGLAVWHDGSDTASLIIVNDQVAVWADKSGNNHPLGPVAGEALPSLSASLQNGMRGVFFDYAAKEMMESDYIAAADGSISAFVVAKRVDASSLYDGGSVYKNILSIGRPDGTTTETGKINITEDRDSGDVRTNAHKVSANNSAGEILWDGKAHILTSILTYATNFSLEGRADGVREELGERTSIGLADELGPLQIGGSTSASSRRFWGTVYEVLIYERALNPAETQIIEKYLSAKWGVVLQS
ncbi:MAG: hypothetical protein R3D71_02415 [Rickettsiales bacterium]